MAKRRVYTVKLAPAKVSPGGRVESMILSDLLKAPTVTVEAASFLELSTIVHKMAHGFGQSCVVHIDIPGSQRKPPGFDVFRDGLQGIHYSG